MAAMTDREAQDRAAQKLEGDRFRAAEFNRKAAVQSLYRTETGRAYLRWLLELTGAIGINPFRGDAEQTAFQCGVLSVGQRLMAHMIETDANLFVNLLKEPNNAPRGTSANGSDDGEPDLFGNDTDEPARSEDAVLYT